MDEGLLGTALGGEEDQPEGEAVAPAGGAATTGAEAFAAAVAAIASRQDPGVAQKTQEFLSDQSRLLKAHLKNLEDEHELRLAHLRNQLREQRIRRSGLLLRVAFQLFIALVATVIGAGILVMLRDAFTSRSVVVESFDAPAALAERGVTGKVVAGGLLDELRRLQSATRADAAKRELSSAWAGEIELAVPEAGISYSEMSRLLKDRFGQDVHIDGDLVQTEAGGLALTVRGDKLAPKTFNGSANELEKLTTDAAQYVYAQSEPVLWAYYLLNRGRMEETIIFSRAAAAGADKSDRPYLLNTWANAITFTGKPREGSRTLSRSPEAQTRLLGCPQQRHQYALGARRRGRCLEGWRGDAPDRGWSTGSGAGDLLPEHRRAGLGLGTVAGFHRGRRRCQWWSGIECRR